MLKLNGYLSLSALLVAGVVAVPASLPACAGAQDSLQASLEATPVATSPNKPAQPNPIDTGDWLRSQHQYEAAIAAYAGSPVMTATLWNKMGIAYQLMLDPKEAVRCYRESLKLDPGNAQILNNLGTVYASLRDYDQADRVYRKALKLDPTSAVILKNLGTNLVAEKEYSKGWRAYQQALAIDPHVFADQKSPKIEEPIAVRERDAVHYDMAVGCARAGHADCALKYLRMALDEGFTDRKKIASSSEFASLRNNPDFQQLVEQPRNQ